jgi:hypothetical protein
LTVTSKPPVAVKARADGAVAKRLAKAVKRARILE